MIGYHSKRLSQSVKNFGITELELTGLLVNIHNIHYYAIGTLKYLSIIKP